MEEGGHENARLFSLDLTITDATEWIIFHNGIKYRQFL